MFISFCVCFHVCLWVYRWTALRPTLCSLHADYCHSDRYTCSPVFVIVHLCLRNYSSLWVYRCLCSCIMYPYLYYWPVLLFGCFKCTSVCLCSSYHVLCCPSLWVVSSYCPFSWGNIQAYQCKTLFPMRFPWTPLWVDGFFTHTGFLSAIVRSKQTRGKVIECEVWEAQRRLRSFQAAFGRLWVGNSGLVREKRGMQLM